MKSPSMKNSVIPPPEISSNYLQTTEEELILLPDFHAGDSATQNPPAPDTIESSEQQNSLSINPQTRSTVDLQACICNLRHKCMPENVVMKDHAFLICVYYPEEGGVDQIIHRFLQMSYMNITHSITESIFEPITSDYMAGNLISTHFSEWAENYTYNNSTLMVVRLERLLDIWFQSKGTVDMVGEVLVQIDGDNMDGTEIDPLGTDTMFTRQSTDYFRLTALLMDHPPCEEFIPGSLPVSIHGGNSIVFACTCDDTNSCIELSFDLTDESSTASMRICIIPQQGNDETADIVRITQLKLDKDGPCGFPFDVVSDGVESSQTSITKVVGDEYLGLVATIDLLEPQVRNPSPITVYGTVEVKLPDSSLTEVPFGTLRYAVVDEPRSLNSCRCEDVNYECITDPSPLSPNELLNLCLLARPRTSEFKSGSVGVLMVQNSYENLIVKDGVAEGNETTILFKNETLIVIETLLDDSAFERSLNYVEFNSFAALETASFSSDVTSYLRLPLYTEPSNTPSVFPSLSHRPTFSGPTFEPTQSNEPTEEQTIRIEYCQCDYDRRCLGVESVTLTPYERKIRICFKALPTTSQMVGTPIVVSNSTIPIPFTTVLDSDMNGGVITGELPNELFDSSVGSAVEVVGKFNVVDGDRNATLGLSFIINVGSVESSTYCSSSTAKLRACACQCDDNNNCVDGLIQTPVSRGEFCQMQLTIE